MIKKMRLNVTFLYIFLLVISFVGMMIIISGLNRYKDHLNNKISKMYTSSRDTIKDRKYIRKKLRMKRRLWVVDILLNLSPVIVIFLVFIFVFKIDNFRPNAKIRVALISIMGVIINWIYEYLKGDKLISRVKIKKMFFKFIEFDDKIGNINTSIKKLRIKKIKDKEVRVLKNILEKLRKRME